MSFTATLIISGQRFNVLDSSFNFSKPTDLYGKPNGIPEGGTIYFTIESSGDNSIIKWMLSYEMIKEGELVFMRRDSLSAMRRITFENAHCILYTENFNATNSMPMIVNFAISCCKLTIDGQHFDKTGLWGSTAAAQPKTTGAASPASAATGDINSFIPD